MFTLIFILFTLVIFGKLFMFAVKASWAILLLPLFLIILVFAGVFYVALPVLAIVGVISLVCSRT